jgi:hypothetical protein
MKKLKKELTFKEKGFQRKRKKRITTRNRKSLERMFRAFKIYKYKNIY